MVSFNLTVNGNVLIKAKEIQIQAASIKAETEDPSVSPIMPDGEIETESKVRKVKGRLIVKATRTDEGVKIELDWERPFENKKEDPWLTDREVVRDDARRVEQVRHKLSQVVTEALDRLKIGNQSLRDLVRKYTMRGLLKAEDYRIRQLTYQLRGELEKTLKQLPESEVNAFREKYGSNFLDILSNGTLSYRASSDFHLRKPWRKKSTIETEIPMVSEVVDPKDVNMMDPVAAGDSTKEEEMKQSLRNAYPGNEKVDQYIHEMEKAHGVGFWNGFESLEDLKEDFQSF